MVNLCQMMMTSWKNEDLKSPFGKLLSYVCWLTKKMIIEPFVLALFALVALDCDSVSDDGVIIEE
jgi:hypothetical protein